MKILKLIDHLFDTSEKRLRSLFVITLFYLIWQNIFQCALFVRLYEVTSYAQLFSFMSDMQRYDHSLIIHIIYYVISHPTLTVSGLINCFSLVDILSMISIILLIKDLIYPFIFDAIKLISLGIILIIAINSTSLSYLIVRLHYLSIIGSIFAIMISIYCLYKIVKLIFDKH